MKSLRWFVPGSLMMLAACANDPAQTGSSASQLVEVPAATKPQVTVPVTAAAATKQEELWKKIVGTADADPQAREWPSLLNLFPIMSGALGYYGKGDDGKPKAFDLSDTGTWDKDEMPYGRPKLVHARGIVAKVEFVPNADSGYTGIYKSGAIGLARFSLASNPNEPANPTFIPGLAVKMFVDGHPSRNVQVMFSVDGQGEDRNFFTNNLTNSLDAPTSAAGHLIGNLFENASSTPGKLGVTQLAGITSDGKDGRDVVPSARLRTPTRLSFHPAKDVLATYKATGTDFRTDLAQIPEGTAVYDVFAVQEDDKPLAKPILVGSLVTKSKMVTSTYGDENLFFKHTLTNATHQ